MKPQFTVKVKNPDGVEIEIFHITAKSQEQAEKIALQMQPRSTVLSSQIEEVKIFTLTLNGDKEYVLKDDNQKVLQRFNTNIYDDYIAIQVSKNIILGIAIDKKINFAIVYKSPAQEVEVCSNCGSSDVDIKGWVNQLTGIVGIVEDLDDSDTWCNNCEGHHGTEFRKPNPEGEVVYRHNHTS